MYERLGKLVERHWRLILCCWGVALALATCVHLGWFSPLGIHPWKKVAKDGEFAFLPPDMQSLVGEHLLATAFPDDLLKSSVVIVVRRYQPEHLLPEDERFIEHELRPRLKKIAEELIGDSALEIRTFKSPLEGKLLVSQDKKASLVILPLKGEFLEWGNKPVIDRIESLLSSNELDKPAGLDLAMSGSATVGRDMLVANDESAKSTELWTTALVIILLVLIYRSPFLALIPLFTVIVSVQISLALVILLTKIPLWDYRIFFGMEVYITVVVYGTGVDYCLFLIARYKEEIDKGLPLRQALVATMANIGAGLTASALTVICGIGMMIFAQFGKFREAGVGISLGLCVGLLAALTLTPSLLRLAGRAVFWPHGRWERIQSQGGWVSGTRLLNKLVRNNKFQVLWRHVGDMLVKRPGAVLVTCILLMLPFAVWGMVNYEYLSYGLLSELPQTKRSVIGAKAVQEHFPAGNAGPLTILVKSEQLDFNSADGHALLESSIQRIENRVDELGIADIRYLKKPLGLHVQIEGQNTKFGQGLRHGVEKNRAPDYYVSGAPDLAGRVTRVDLVFETDPFDRQSIAQLDTVRGALRQAIDETVKETQEELGKLKNDSDPETVAEIDASLAACNDFKSAELHFVGPTASIRDLKTVTDRDQVKIDLLVLVVVFAILVLLLRKPAISFYLIISVFFSYFVALGVTFGVFQLIDGKDFSGLDWKVPMFLFTILMAIGEDYNIFLMTRIEEEQLQHGPVEGVRVAMLKTGTIISSCGIIMAGTFLSLLAGTLVGLKQLGFALAFGVLLDTFVVRPLLVPAYLILLYKGWFGPATRFLGGTPPPAAGPAHAPRPKSPSIPESRVATYEGGRS